MTKRSHRIDPGNYRTALEKQRDEILAVLEHPESYSRLQLVKELRAIVDELQNLDEGKSWINVDDTQPKIELDLGRKILRTLDDKNESAFPATRRATH